MNPIVEHFYDEATGTFSYIVQDAFSNQALIVDPVLNFDLASGECDYSSANELLSHIATHNLQVAWILETHAHADHLTAAQYLKEKTGAKVAIGKGIVQVQQTFRTFFNFGRSFAVDGSQFDHCFSDGDSFMLGETSVQVLATPGHTNDSVTYLIGNAAFIGDTLFHPELGTARCDFPGGNASLLYQSIQKLLALPVNTRLFLCHDYPEGGREPVCQVSIDEQKASNIHVNDGNSESDFVRFREQRDKQLAVPKLIYPAVQVNIAAGHLPARESNGTHYLKIPARLPREQ